VKAYELLAAFKANGPTAPPTVYRALDALVQVGLAHRLPSLNAYIACRHDGVAHAAVFLICDECRSTEEIQGPAKAILEQVRANSAFQVSDVAVEIRGRCAVCERRRSMDEPIPDWG